MANTNTNVPRTKKFWCHYMGNDGNTPKRRSIELTSLGSLIPYVGDTQHFITPLWYEEVDDYYHVYAQVSDKVADEILNGCFWKTVIKDSKRTNEEIDAYWKARLEDPEDWIEEKFAESYAKKHKEERDRTRKRVLDIVHRLKDYDSYLLTSASWITKSTIRAYEEIHSPILSTLQALRRAFVAQREEEERKREEERRKRCEEEERKEAEKKAKEYERITDAAQKFKAGESISGCDVVELCRRYGIGVHLRTVHNLQCVIVSINGKDGTCRYYRGKGRKPVLDGCYLAASKLYDYLRKNEIY